MARESVGGERLGGLEAELLELLWRAPEPPGVRELLLMLAGPRRAYATMVTVLRRPVDKALVEPLDSHGQETVLHHELAHVRLGHPRSLVLDER